MLSPMDDYPLHQVSDVIRHAGSSDRNFYDRYYFNMHASSDELFMVMGMGQYPNLSTQDAFAVVRRGDEHHVVRGSRVLGDRMDTSVGPFRIEVEKGLERVRFILEESAENPIAMDVTWQAAIPAFLEPRHYIRRHGRVLFDTTRFAQTGCWSGSLRVGDTDYTVSPDNWKGSRDRSWGIRPVGEHEPPGIQQGFNPMEGLWNYVPMQFDDYSIVYMNQESNDGTKVLYEGMKVWNDPNREPEWLGDAEYDFSFTCKDPYRAFIDKGEIRFPDAPGGGLTIAVTPLTHVWVMVGTGYGLEPDWKHGMYQGELEVQRMSLSLEKDADRMLGLVDNVARFEVNGDVGYGLFEYGIFGRFDRFGME